MFLFQNYETENEKIKNSAAAEFFYEFYFTVTDFRITSSSGLALPSTAT